MASIDDIGAALVTAIESELSAYSIEVIKADPRFGEVTLTPPTVALSLDRAELARDRLGGLRKNWSWNIIVYGDYEEQMWLMVEALIDWIVSTGKITADSDQHVLGLTDESGRQLNETDMEEGDHAFLLNVITQGI